LITSDSFENFKLWISPTPRPFSIFVTVGGEQWHEQKHREEGMFNANRWSTDGMCTLYLDHYSDLFSINMHKEQNSN